MTAPYEPPRLGGPHPAGRLAEVKARRAEIPPQPWVFNAMRPEDVDWLIGEVQDRRTDLAMAFTQLQDAVAEIGRLRGRLAELEWAGNWCEEREPACPVCHAVQLGDGVQQPGQHGNECWLAKELNVGRGE